MYKHDRTGPLAGPAFDRPLTGSPGATPADVTRREFLQFGAVGGIAAAFAIFWNGRLLSPTQAKAEDIPLVNLTKDQGVLLEAVAETLLPGARDAGVANFVDTQLGRKDPMLILKYFDWPGDYTDFYTQGLAAVDKASQTTNGKTFAKASADEQNALMGGFLENKVKGWDGPPAPLFYFAVRGDAVDVMYGTVEGFQRLGIPYMPHILPEERW